jgi:hypothetical protein
MATRNGEHGLGLHKMYFFRTVIDGGVHVFKRNLESDVFDS